MPSHSNIESKLSPAIEFMNIPGKMRTSRADRISVRWVGNIRHECQKADGRRGTCQQQRFAKLSGDGSSFGANHFELLG